MSEADPFIIFWCALVAVLVCVNVAWALRDLSKGSSRLVAGRGEFAKRSERPAVFWLAISGKLLALPVGALMIWFVLTVAPK